jgi:hypothetical protein
MNINWTETCTEESRISINDGVIPVYADESDLPDEFTLREVALAYAEKYDHNGNSEGFVVAIVEDLMTGDPRRFAFNGEGNFEWDTDRDWIS